MSVAEELNEHTFIGIEICLFDYTDTNVFEIIEAFRKVFTNLDKFNFKIILFSLIQLGEILLRV